MKDILRKILPLLGKLLPDILKKFFEKYPKLGGFILGLIPLIVDKLL